MGKPLAGDVVVLPFPQTDRQAVAPSVIRYVAGKVKQPKLRQARAKMRELFS